MNTNVPLPQDSIAIVGIGCRLPGGIDSLDSLWTALVDERDLVTDTAPADRFDAAHFYSPDARRPGTAYTLAGGYLDDLAAWDADYFGISPREAARLDPQHRLLLEMTVDALDDASIDAATLVGSDTGVYVGMFERGYGHLQSRDPHSVDTTTLLGTLGTAAPNRLSYFLDARGPSVLVDTACSSALIAVHLACESLLLGRSRLALAGGVNALVNPYEFVLSCKAQALAYRGRCRTFSAEADGYARAEGGGMIVLKRLTDALADGDHVHAVILGSRTNCDGHTDGLAHPGVDSQTALLREVYEQAGVAPDQLAYFEAHGTGTPAGDPVECEAVGRALGAARTNGPLPIGSVKTNIGHLEAAAGMAGIFKAILTMRHGRVPRSLHCENLNPAIDFDRLRLSPARQATALQSTGRPIVGVNSFGIGGANAHVILAAPDRRGADPAADDGARLLPFLVSGHTVDAAVAATKHCAERLATAAPGEFYDLAYTSCRRRGRRDHRTAVLARTASAAAAALATAEPVAAVRTGRIAFVFSGNGSQWPGMGATLLREEPVFAATVTEVDTLLRPLLGWSVLDELRTPGDGSRLARTEIAQPTLFAVQIGLASALAALGIRPSAVAGHSVGEVAAACVAGAYDLATACRVIAERSAAQAITAGAGRMAAVGLSFADAERAIADFRDRLEIAGVNSESDVTVAGDHAALAELGHRLRDRDVFFRMLDLDYGFHSRAMDPIESDLHSRLAGLTATDPVLPMISTVTAGPLSGADLDAAYWWRNVREPVLFAPAVSQLAAQDCDVFVEIGPHPVLSGYLRKLGADRPIAVVPTMRREDDASARIHAAVAAVLAAGGAVDWDRFFPRTGRVVDLPAYPWQRERHWHGDPQWWTRRLGDGRIRHPLLGERADLAQPAWHLELQPQQLAWLADHRVDDAVVMPAAAYVEMAVAAGFSEYDGPIEVVGLGDLRALTLPWDDPGMDVHTQVSFDTGNGALAIASRSGGGSWQSHAKGVVRRLTDTAPDPVDTRSPSAGTVLDRAEFYAALAAIGLPYGPAFQVVRSVHADTAELVARYDIPPGDPEFLAHPLAIDAALQAFMPLLPGERLYLPSGFDSIKVWRRPADHGVIRVRRHGTATLEPVADIVIADADGTVAITMTGVRLRFQRHTTVPLQHHVTELRAAPRTTGTASAHPLPDCATVLAAAVDRLGTAATRDCRAAADLLAATTRYHGHLAARALTEFCSGRTDFTATEIVDAGIRATYAGLVDLMIDLAHSTGLIEPVPGGATTRWRWRETPRPEALFESLVTDHPEFTTVQLVFGHTAARLPEILRGDLDAVEVLFSEQDSHFIERVYSTWPAHLDNLRRAAALVAEMVERWPADRPLRILEVGGGTGMLTAELLPLLPPERTRYVFTDVSPWFLPRARNRFQDFDFVEYRAYDLDRPPLDQGFAAAEFDLVIGGYVVHAAADLRAALRGLGVLLSGGGQLLAVETHDPLDLAVCFGALESFWRFTDSDLRTRSPLLGVPEWTRVLAEAGFTEVVDFGDGERPVRNSVLLARHPATIGEPPATPTPPGGRWLVAAESADRGLADALPAAWTRIPPAREPADWAAALAAVGKNPNIVLLLGGSDGDDESSDLEVTLRRAAVLRALATAIERGGHTPNLWLVTRPGGTFGPPEDSAHPVDAAAWALARCLATEQPALTLRAISLDRTGDPAARLLTELADPGDEDEIVSTARGRFVPRHRALRPSAIRPDAGAHYGLRLTDPGSGYRLTWMTVPERRPGRGEVLIAVAAAALNYRDTMQATGRIEPQPGAGSHPIGFDCAGIVAAVGPGVTAPRVGDRVFALAFGACASHVIARADLVGVMPDGMSFTQAATLPVAYLTVHRGLHELARPAPGETILIHAGAGGVGLAALRYARHIGATVVATAGTPVKRALLRMLGVAHVFDSRDPGFAEQISAAVGSVDVVLNSLTGEAVTRSLELLRPGGRFLELGLIDPNLRGTTVATAAPRSLTVASVDIHDQWLHRNADDPCYPEFVAAVRSGVYRPLPHTVYPADRAGEAFRALRHSRHIGKVVISLETPPAITTAVTGPALDPHASYLITGGSNGFGAAAAHWLAEHGARTIVLASRRGPSTPEAAALVADLTARGAHPVALAADTTDARTMRELLDAQAAQGHPVRGIIHAAAVLDDAPSTEYTDERLRAVLAPKIAGGRVLHELTRDRDLDFFIAYSSFANTVANRNQSGYVAGNAYLESLTRLRRQSGLPGLAVCWGAIADAGHVARNDLADTMSGLGFGLADAARSTATLSALLASGAAVATAHTPDWERLAAMFPLVSRPRFADMLPAAPESDTESRTLSRRVREAPEPEAVEAAQQALVGLIARILQTGPDRVPPTHRLTQLGVDSLMATEVMVAIRRQFDCDVPLLEVASATVAELARRLVLRLRQPAAPLS